MLIVRNEIKYYYKENLLHREDGPAIEYPDGSKCWYLNDKLHREDGPAIIGANRDTEWFIHGERHRVGGPAVEYFLDGKTVAYYQEWYFNGKIHREDGPAIINSGREYFYYDGDAIDCSSTIEFLKLIKLKAFW